MLDVPYYVTLVESFAVWGYIGVPRALGAVACANPGSEWYFQR